MASGLSIQLRLEKDVIDVAGLKVYSIQSSRGHRTAIALPRNAVLAATQLLSKMAAAACMQLQLA